MKTEILDYDQEGVYQTAEPELPEITHFVEDIELAESTTETDSCEDRSSAVPVESNFYDEDAGDEDAFEPVEKSVQPSTQEVQEVLQQFRLNAEIQRTVRRYWVNVPGAISPISRRRYGLGRGLSHQRLYLWRLARRGENQKRERPSLVWLLGLSGRGGRGL